jgi:hypothetical protein
MRGQVQFEEGRREELHAQLRELASGTSTPALEENARELVRVLWTRQGAAHAMRAGEILDSLRLPRNDKWRRWLKDAVNDLVVLHGLPVGGLRVPPYGYFLIVSANDLDLAIHPLWGEVYALLRRLRALTSKHDVARLFGQAMLDLDKNASPDRGGGERNAA